MYTGLVDKLQLETCSVWRVSGSAFTASKLSGLEITGSESKCTGHRLVSKEMVYLYPVEGRFHFNKGNYS